MAFGQIPFGGGGGGGFGFPGAAGGGFGFPGQGGGGFPGQGGGGFPGQFGGGFPGQAQGNAFGQQQQGPPAFAQAFQRLGIPPQQAGGPGQGFTGLSDVFQRLFGQGGFQGGMPSFGGFGGAPQPAPADFGRSLFGGASPVAGPAPIPAQLPQDGLGQSLSPVAGPAPIQESFGLMPQQGQAVSAPAGPVRQQRFGFGVR